MVPGTAEGTAVVIPVLVYTWYMLYLVYTNTLREVYICVWKNGFDVNTHTIHIVYIIQGVFFFTVRKVGLGLWCIPDDQTPLVAREFA